MQSAGRMDNELDPAPINPAWIREGSPEARVRHWGRSRDGATNTYVWSCTAGTFSWTFDEDEIVHVVEGSVTVTSPQGVVRTLGVGDSGFFPAGTTWLWHIPTYLRKHAVLVRPLPAPVRHSLRAARKARRTMEHAGFGGRAARWGVAAGSVAATGAAGWVAADMPGLGALLGL